MIKSFSFILFLFLTFYVSSFAANASEKTKIVLFGDSIIAGYGLAENETLSVKLQSYLNNNGLEAIVINAGVSGDTSSGGLSRLQWTLETYQPDLLFIGLGGNDMLRGVAPLIVKGNIESMLKMADNFGVKTILNEVVASPNLGLRYKKEFDKIYTDIRQANNVKTYPFLLTNTFGKRNLMQNDLIHPSAAGIDTIVKDLGPYILKEAR